MTESRSFSEVEVVASGQQAWGLTTAERGKTLCLEHESLSYDTAAEPKKPPHRSELEPAEDLRWAKQEAREERQRMTRASKSITTMTTRMKRKGSRLNV